MLTTVGVQTNSTRAKTLELHIAQRVAAELEKLKKHESSVLEEARKKILESSDDKSGSESGSEKGSLLSIPSISPSDLLDSKEDKRKKNVTSTKVQEEIEKLRQTLDSRKILNEVPREVEAA